MKRIASVFVVGLAVLGLLVGCSEDEIEKQNVSGNGVIKGKVYYDGQKVVKRLGFAISDDPTDPPTSMPLKMFYVPEEPVEEGISFPVEYTADGLPDGTFYIKVYGDVDTSDGPMPKEIDPQTPFVGPIKIENGSTATQDLTLSDDYVPGGDYDTEVDSEPSAEGEAPQPEAGRAALYGFVNYSGDKTGKLYVLGFSTNPPSGMPTFIISIDDPQFPQYYEKTNIRPGTHYVISYIDVDPDDGMGINDVDPSSGDYQEVTLEEGESVQLDFTLQ